MLKFAFGVGFDLNFMRAASLVRAARRAERASKVPYLSRKMVIDHFLGQEMLPVTDYMPDFDALTSMREKVSLAAGRTSLRRHRFYAEVAPILARKLGCRMVELPGHHASFADMPDEWSAALRDALQA
jgi:hypothetical protein